MPDQINLGEALVIPQEIFEKIKELDIAIDDVAVHSESMSKKFHDHIGSMSADLNPLIKKLESISTIMDGVSTTKESPIKNFFEGVGNASKQAEQAAEQLSKVSVALNKINTSITDIAQNKEAIKAVNELSKLEDLNEINKRKNAAIEEAEAIKREREEIKRRTAEEKRAKSEETAASINAHSAKMDAMRKEKAEQKAADALQKRYLDALALTESTELSRIKKIERLKSVYEEMRTVLGDNAEQTVRAANAVNRLVQENNQLAQSRDRLRSREAEIRNEERALRAYDKAMAASENTYTQSANKIIKLKAAQELLNRAADKYPEELKKIEEELKRLTALNREQEASYRNIHRHHNKLLDTSSQLARKLALVFSVSQIQGYLMNVVKITGEFEKQNVALASILQNKTQADILFRQITELAVKSPFQLKELVTYTKSLSAYQVEYEKLYDTTKRLADVSAGLGVDMQRLILAFGQVKAANFLRGTEVRQFTEAGLNILGELAKYYSELEGKMVSVGDVQERVTKRMVAFGDVEEVFKRLTSAGGIFYKMQEKQAETIAGQMSNLQDSIDIMLNDIGRVNSGLIKNIIGVVRSMVEGWKHLANIMDTTAAAFAVYTVSVVRAAIKTKAFAAANIEATIASGGLAAVVGRVTKALKALAVAMKGHPLYVIGSVLALAAMELKDHYDSIQEIREEYDKATKSLNDYGGEVNDLIVKLNRQNKIVKDTNDKVDSLEKGTYEYARAEEEANKQRKIQNGLLNELKTKYPEIYAGIVKQKDGTVDLTNAQKQFNMELNASTYIISKLKETEGFFSDGFYTNLSDASEAQTELATSAENLQVAFVDVDVNLRKFLDSSKRVSPTLRKEVLSVLDSSDEVGVKMQKLIKIWQSSDSVSKAAFGNAMRGIKDVYDDYKEKQEDFNKANKELGKDIETSAKSFKGAMKSLGIETEEQARRSLDAVIENLNIQDQKIKEFVKQKFYVTVGLKFEGFDKLTDGKSKFSILEQRVQDYLTKRQFIKIPQVRGGEGTDKYFKDLTASYNDWVKEAERVKRASQELYDDKSNKERLAELEVLISQSKKTLKDWGVLEEKESKKKKQNTGDENAALKEQIRLLGEARTTYQKYLEVFSKDDAWEKVKEDFKESPVEIILESMKGLDTADIIAAYDKILQTATEKGKQIVRKAIRKEEREEELRNAQEFAEKLKAEIDAAFESYDFSKELLDKGIDVSALKNMLKTIGASTKDIKLLNLDTASLDEAAVQIRQKIEELRKKGGDKNLELAKKSEEKLTQMYLNEAKSRFDELLSLREKYYTRQQKIDLLELDIARWEAELSKLSAESDAEERERLQLKIRNAQDAIDELKSKALELTDFWKMLFSNLDDLSLKSIKDLLRQRDEVINSAEEFTDASGKKKYKATYIDAESVKHDVTLTKKQFEQLVKSKKNLDKEFSKRSPIELFFRTLFKGKEKGEKTEDYLRRLKGDFLDAGDAAFDAAGDFLTLAGASEKTQRAFASAKQIWDGSKDLFSGIGEIATGNIIGGALQSVKGLAKVTQAIRNIHDSKRERAIERELKQVEELEKSYERLKEAIESAYDVDLIESTTEAMNASLRAQNAALKRSIAAEEDKKKKDQARIDEWYDQIEENNKKIEENMRAMYESFGAFGTDEAVKSAAQEFVDTWTKAQLEVGNGFDALQDKMSEWVQNAIQKQLLTNLGKQYIQPILDSFNQMFDKESIGGTKMTPEELAAWRKLYESKSKEFDEKAKEYLDALQALSPDLGKEGADKLSGLQRSIGSVSEETAQVLSAILESTRYFVADSNAKLGQILAAFSLPNPDNPFLMELKLQTEQLRLMSSLWNSLTTTKVGIKGKVLQTVLV